MIWSAFSSNAVPQVPDKGIAEWAHDKKDLTMDPQSQEAPTHEQESCSQPDSQQIDLMQILRKLGK